MKLHRFAAATLVASLLATAVVVADDKQPPAGQTGQHAKVGQVAPDFQLEDLAGTDLSLAAYKGKVVVLEWFDPDCPFVAKHHRANPIMRDLAAKWGKEGVIWLAVASTKSAEDRALLEKRRAEWNITYPIMLDTDGKVAAMYGARTTPHMFVIDASGKLAYSGAIDDSADKETVGRTNYVDKALRSILDGEPVETPTTFPYGTRVQVDEKYVPPKSPSE